ncbi:MAG: protease inhibitor I9 family protein, partial [Bellilinea sp.]|nr:protease inhibitor I9 family protein [Bellilinea sp.]
MKSILYFLFAATLLFVMVVVTASAGVVPAYAASAPTTHGMRLPFRPQEGLAADASAEAQSFNGRYIVLFEGNSLVQGFSNDSRQIQLDSPDALAYLNLLRREQDSRLAQINRVIGRSLRPVFRYDLVLNGFALQLSPVEAARIRALPGVRAVIPDRLEQPLTDACLLYTS